MKSRCSWVTKNPLYIKYHDTEWGVPVFDDKKLFEFIILESFQSGLSWVTILKKRENFRKALNGFNYEKIETYTDEKLKELQKNKGIIRNKLKIKAIVSNAKAFIKVREEFGSFSKYIWAFVNHKPIKNEFFKNKNTPPVTTKLSDKIANDLKKRGFKFVGSTTVYAFMQAIGMVNNHTPNCFKHTKNSFCK